MSAPLFEVSHLTARYGSLTAVDDVTLAFDAGRRIGIFGHNGSGKSTLLKSLIGAIEDISGSVQFDGHTIEPGATHRNVQYGIGFVPQSRNVFPSLAVEQCLRIAGMQTGRTVGAQTSGMAGIQTSRTAGTQMIDAVFEIFPILRERREQRAGSMSGGQQQMLAVGMALMRQPKAILLDEPTAGLSPVVAQTVLKSLVTINEKLGAAVILVEQNVLAALEIVERAIVLKTGKLALDTEARALQNKADLWRYF